MFYTPILDAFQTRLAEIQESGDSSLKKADLAIHLCNTTLENLRKSLQNHSFENVEAEIHFFKSVKLEPMSKLVLYTEVRSCELKLPKWGLDSKFEFLEVEIQRINSFFDHHLDFQLYMEQGRTLMDLQYFTRKHLNDHLLVTAHTYFRDPLFNTSHDELLSTIKGLGLYGNYLKGLNASLNAKAKIPLDRKHQVPYQFTMPPTAAMEFIYAFKELRAFNHGNFDIKPFTDYFCKVFGIEIKDPYGLFAQIANRKTKRAKYIQMLLDAFLNSLKRRDDFL